jgi:hypothetical protein
MEKQDDLLSIESDIKILSSSDSDDLSDVIQIMPQKRKLSSQNIPSNKKLSAVQEWLDMRNEHDMEPTVTQISPQPAKGSDCQDLIDLLDDKPISRICIKSKLEEKLDIPDKSLMQTIVSSQPIIRISSSSSEVKSNQNSFISRPKEAKETNITSLIHIRTDIPLKNSIHHNKTLNINIQNVVIIDDSITGDIPAKNEAKEINTPSHRPEISFNTESNDLSNNQTVILVSSDKFEFGIFKLI